MTRLHNLLRHGLSLEVPQTQPRWDLLRFLPSAWSFAFSNHLTSPLNEWWPHRLRKFLRLAVCLSRSPWTVDTVQVQLELALPCSFPTGSFLGMCLWLTLPRELNRHDEALRSSISIAQRNSPHIEPQLRDFSPQLLRLAASLWRKLRPLFQSPLELY